MVTREDDLRLAIRNVALWGDTDVLPFPIENHWFHDDEPAIVELLNDLDRDYESWLEKYPVVSERLLSAVGHFGFRVITQIDAIWNAYLLALLIRIGPDLEAARVSVAKGCVFSYRFSPDIETSTLFDKNIGWHAFQTHALQVASAHAFVMSTDISNFYPRAYHHRIKNELDHATSNSSATARIETLLKKLSIAGVSYGLPVGGNASRMLAEILLNRSDRLLALRGVKYCRFVDDYYLFADTEEEARRALFCLSDILMTHEGLDLQRSKTRLMTREEFYQASPVADSVDADSSDEAEAQGFLRLRIKYDPYSLTAEEDYQLLRDELARYDVVGMLSREMRKSRVDEVLTRQLVKSLKFLTPEVREAAVLSLADNLETLYPILPTVCLVLKGLVADLPLPALELIFSKVRGLIRQGSHLFLVPANLSYAVRLLADDASEGSSVLLNELYRRADVPAIVKRDLIIAFARRGETHWVADVLRRDLSPSASERRAQIPASYVLGDEGSHWRNRVKRELGLVDRAYMKWIGKKNSGRRWEIPL